MSTGFVKINGTNFVVNNKKIIFRGFGIPNFLNIEHFLIGLPGSESQIRRAIIDAYGQKESEIFWEKFYKCYLNEKDFEFFKYIGINSIRLSFNYHIFESDQDPYNYNKKGFKQIDRALDLCDKYKIYAILDLHSAPGGQNPDWHSDNAIGECLFWEYADFRNRTIALWEYIANKYKNNPWIAAYDLLNEPCLYDINGKPINDFYGTIIKKIRKIDNNHILFIEGDFYARDFTCFKQFDDPNIAYSFHYYAFFNQNKFLSGDILKKVETDLFENITLDYIQNKLKKPIWCGETGILLNSLNKELQENILKNTIIILEKYNISWSLWDYKDARSMGSLFPSDNSKWMEFSRKACNNWEFWHNQRESEVEVENLFKKYSINKNEKKLNLKLKFRIMANNQLLYIENYKKLFSKIKFEDLLTYPEAFLFDKCEQWNEIIEMIKHYNK